MGKVKDLTNQRFGRLIAIKPNKIVNSYMMWTCKCDCGGEIITRSNSLLTGKIKSCGCIRTENAQTVGRGRLKDITGKQFGELTVIKEHSRSSKEIVWECQCSCGTTTFIRGKDLKSHNTQSCGCIKKEAQTESGKKQIKLLHENNMIEDTNLGILSCGVSKRNKSGIKGVFWLKARKKWKATLTFKGEKYELGLFDNIEDAAKARAVAEEKYFEPILKKYGRETHAIKGGKLF